MSCWIEYVCLTLLTVFCATASITVTDSLATDSNTPTQCPTWFIPTQFSNGSVKCKCGSTCDGIVHCDDKTGLVYLDTGYCMTESEIFKDVVVGVCAFPTSILNQYKPSFVPRNMSRSQLNNYMCGDVYREKQLCGQCISGYAPGMYNQCVKCTSHGLEAVNVFVFQLLMATVFFVLVVVLRVSAASDTICAFVFYSQVLSVPGYAFGTLQMGESFSQSLSTFSKLLISFYGVWNLDFFLPFFPDFCFHEDANALEALALQYILPAYLLTLTITMYVAVELNARNYRLVVWLWKPFDRCLVRLRRRWNMKVSVINAFATLLLLSYTKVTFISLRMLYWVTPYNSHGRQSSTAFILADPTLEYGGKEHLPYLLMALFFFITVGLVPTVFLTFYQFRWFQRCLDLCRLNRQGLRTFVELFQGSYRNGVVGQYDLRFFSGVYLILRLLIFLDVPSGNISGAYRGILCVCAIQFFVFFRPYRNYLYNVVDSLFFSCFTISIFSETYYQTHLHATMGNVTTAAYVSLILTYILMSLPVLYITIVIIYWVSTKLGITVLVQK